MHVIDCSQAPLRATGLKGAASAVRRGDLVLLPMEHSYAIATDAFSERGAQRLRQAKGQGPSMPLPVLVPAASTVMGLATSVPQASGHPIAIRMPLHPVALELLQHTGPLIATAANSVGLEPPASVTEAIDQLGEAFACCLDAGPLDADGEPSTVVDCTGATVVVLRSGAIGLDLIREVCPQAVEAPSSP
jgi:tRNA A37 threonylcarbamoyladenosine synthetase subunit TsaC/SUA5/YrdC